MKKAYCAYDNFDEEAINIVKNNSIDLTVHTTKDRPNGEELITLLKENDILFIGPFSRLTADMVQYIDKPKIIATCSVGLDHIDKSFFESPLITMISLKTANTVSVAEHILGLILSLNKRIAEGNHLSLKGEGYRKNVYDKPEDISNKTLGLIGAGNITRELIKMAKVFNMDIKCFTKNPDNHQDLLEYGVEFLSLDEVLKQSDFINVSIPLNEETRNLISKEKIDLLKPTATFINTARAAIVDTKALIDYADKYDTFYVGLDIDLDEHKEMFMKYRKNVIVTPHLAGISKQALERMDLEIANKVVEANE